MSSNTRLAYLYGQPQATALLRQQNDDFIVEEQLNFTPTGEGEHILLFIEKIGQNTQFVAKQIAELTGLKARDISYAGLKDRHAVTRQWFCFKWPIKQELDWQAWQIEGCNILSMQRHYRKLRLGALKANHFQIRLRQVSDASNVLQRAEQVKHGVPNYYGEQRFGIDGGNLALAKQLFAFPFPTIQDQLPDLGEIFRLGDPGMAGGAFLGVDRLTCRSKVCVDFRHRAFGGKL